MVGFTDHEDPDKDISKDLENVSLEKQYKSLSQEEKFLVFLKINGFYKRPVSIMEFISDPYYLGGPDLFDGGSKVFDYWKTNLQEIYPTPVSTRYIYSIFSGSVGQGKSVTARTMGLYILHRLICLQDPSKTLKISPKTLGFYYQHRSEDTAISDFIKPTRDIIKMCPFFRNNEPRFQYRLISAGVEGEGHMLGTDLIYSVQSEVNFYPNQERAKGAISNAYGRLTSRFSTETLQMFGGLVVDSSAKGDMASTEWCLQNFPMNRTFYSHPAHYEVRPELYRESKGETFSIYVGDGVNKAQILPIDYKLLPDMDPARVYKVPIQLRPEALQSLERCIQDKLGVCTGATDLFYSGDNMEKVRACMKNGGTSGIPEVISIDFYDKTDSIIDHIKPAIYQIPRGKSVFVGLDIGVKQDYTGLSIVGFDRWETFGNSRLPRVKSYLSVAISRKQGQETSIHHIFELIMTLRKMGYNPIVSADQAFSRQILQDCEREGITVHPVSTDNIPCRPALYLKNLILQEAISIPMNRRLLREIHDLRNVETGKGIKVDHPKRATQDPIRLDENNGVGSKDVHDSLCSAVYSLKMSIDAGEEDGYSSGVTKQLGLVSEMTNSSQESSAARFQDMFEDIWG